MKITRKLVSIFLAFLLIGGVFGGVTAHAKSPAPVLSTTSISAGYDGGTYSFKITNGNNYNSLSVSANNSMVYNITLPAKNANGYYAANCTVTFSVYGNPNYSIRSCSISVSGRDSADGVPSDTKTITVTQAAKPYINVTSVTVSPSSATIYNKGDTYSLSATVNPTNASNKTVSWSSSDTRVATVSSSGTVTAQGIGTATITAKGNEGTPGTCSITVPGALRLNPVSKTDIPYTGGSYQFKITNYMNYSSLTIVSKPYWISSASIDSAGMCTYTVSNNPYTSARPSSTTSDAIVVRGQYRDNWSGNMVYPEASFSVRQAGNNSKPALSPASKDDIPYTGGTYEFTVTNASSFSSGLSISSKPDWVTSATISGTTGVCTYTVQGHTASTQKSGAIGVVGKRFDSSLSSTLEYYTDFPVTQLAAPTAPTLSASVSDTSVTLTWSTVSWATSYEVYQDGTRIGSKSKANDPSWYVSDLARGATYSFYVKAINGSDTANSNTKSVTIPALTAPTLTASVSGTSVTLKWGTVSWATSYEVYQDGTRIGSKSKINDPSWYVSDLAPGSHIFYVKAINGRDTAKSDEQTVTILVAPVIIPNETSGLRITINSGYPNDNRVKTYYSVEDYYKGIDYNRDPESNPPAGNVKTQLYSAPFSIVFLNAKESATGPVYLVKAYSEITENGVTHRSKTSEKKVYFNGANNPVALGNYSDDGINWKPITTMIPESNFYTVDTYKGYIGDNLYYFMQTGYGYYQYDASAPKAYVGLISRYIIFEKITKMPVTTNQTKYFMSTITVKQANGFALDRGSYVTFDLDSMHLDLITQVTSAQTSPAYGSTITPESVADTVITAIKTGIAVYKGDYLSVLSSLIKASQQSDETTYDISQFSSSYFGPDGKLLSNIYLRSRIELTNRLDRAGQKMMIRCDFDYADDEIFDPNNDNRFMKERQADRQTSSRHVLDFTDSGAVYDDLKDGRTINFNESIEGFFSGHRFYDFFEYSSYSWVDPSTATYSSTALSGESIPINMTTDAGAMPFILDQDGDPIDMTIDASLQDASGTAEWDIAIKLTKSGLQTLNVFDGNNMDNIIMSLNIFVEPIQPEMPSLTGLVQTYNPQTPTTVQLLPKAGGQPYEIIIPADNNGSGQVTQRFTFDGVLPGDYSLVVTKPGHASYTVQYITVGTEDIDLSPLSRAGGQAIALPCGDISGDGMINDGDLAILWLASNYNKSAEQANKLCDLNGDGMINDGDLAILWLASNYNKGAVLMSNTAPVTIHTVTFAGNGGSAVNPVNIEHGDFVPEPEEPVRTGYIFQGWFKDSDLTSEWDFSIDTVLGETTLYAKWTLIKYRVTFQSDGGSAVIPVDVEHGGLVPKPANPTRANYSFEGWYKDSALTAAWNFSTDRVLGATNLYAKWKQSQVSVTLTNYGTSGVGRWLFGWSDIGATTQWADISSRTQPAGRYYCYVYYGGWSYGTADCSLYLGTILLQGPLSLEVWAGGNGWTRMSTYEVIGTSAANQALMLRLNRPGGSPQGGAGTNAQVMFVDLAPLETALGRQITMAEFKKWYGTGWTGSKTVTIDLT